MYTGVAKCISIFHIFFPANEWSEKGKVQNKCVCVQTKTIRIHTRQCPAPHIAWKPVMMGNSGMEFKVCKTICVFCILRAHPSWMVVRDGGVMCEHARTIQIRKWFFFPGSETTSTSHQFSYANGKLKQTHKHTHSGCVSESKRAVEGRMKSWRKPTCITFMQFVALRPFTRRKHGWKWILCVAAID